MSDTSGNLIFRCLQAGQAQMHIERNESPRRLDVIIQLSVDCAATAVQSGTPTDGVVYILPSGESGAQWVAFADGSLAYYRDAAWEEVAPREGWQASVRHGKQEMPGLDAMNAYTTRSDLLSEQRVHLAPAIPEPAIGGVAGLQVAGEA